MNTLTARKILDSAKPSEMVRVVACGHDGIVMPAAGGQDKFHLSYYTADDRIFVATTPLTIGQLAITFEKYGFPVDAPYESVQRIPCEGFDGFERNPYTLDEDERAALLGSDYLREGVGHEYH